MVLILWILGRGYTRMVQSLLCIQKAQHLQIGLEKALFESLGSCCLISRGLGTSSVSPLKTTSLDGDVPIIQPK